MTALVSWHVYTARGPGEALLPQKKKKKKNVRQRVESNIVVPKLMVTGVLLSPSTFLENFVNH